MKKRSYKSNNPTITEQKNKITKEVEEICNALVRKKMIDEISEKTFLDVFIEHRYEMLRNELRRQKLEQQEYLKSLDMAIRTEIKRKQNLCQMYRRELQRYK